MPDMFPARFRQYAPERPKLRKPEAAPVRFAAGYCNAACMFAIGPDCDCPCLGANHRAGFRCEPVNQQEMVL